MQREKATHKEDLPHDFEGYGNFDCHVCGANRSAALHVEWARVEQASRETAAGHKSSPTRELGV